MKDPKYDQYGGITDILDCEVQSKTENSKKKTGYNFIEKFLIKNSKRANLVLDENNKYKCRNHKAPKTIRLGVTNRCTARCFYCPREYIHTGETGYMDFELYKKIAEWAKKNEVKTFAFALFGEPLLHLRLIEMIELAINSGLDVRLSTNAIILNKELANKILTLPISAIEISMDGFTREEYLKGKQVDKYDKARENALYLLKRAREKKVKTGFNLHFVDVGNISQVNKIKYIKFWKNELRGLKHATSFSYEPHNWAGTRDELLEKMNFFDKLLTKLEFRKPCGFVTGLAVNWNGDVVICSNNPKKSGIIGNANNESLGVIYNKKDRLKYLDAHEKGDLTGLDCEVCTVNRILPLSFIKKRIVNSIIEIFS